jgi:hypothetical protein
MEKVVFEQEYRAFYFTAKQELTEKIDSRSMHQRAQAVGVTRNSPSRADALEGVARTYVCDRDAVIHQNQTWYARSPKR